MSTRSKNPADALMTSTTGRPVPLVRRPGLVFRRVTGRAGSYWAVKDPVALKYTKLSPAQHTLLGRLDGTRSLEELAREVSARHPEIYWHPRDVQQQLGQLRDVGVLQGDRPGAAAVDRHRALTTRRKKILGTLKSILFLKLPGFDPTRLLDVLTPLFGWFFSRTAVAVVGVLVTCGLLWSAANAGEIRAALPTFSNFFGPQNLLLLWGVVVVTKLFHEFGHAISCRRLGASCHEIGVLLFMFGPTLYCDTTDGWMLASRWRRIAIGAAGMYVEAFLGTAALVAWTLTPDGIGRSLLLNLSLVTAVSTVLFNLNPLMRLDGYYILSDLLGVPNLKQRSDRVVGRVLGHLCLGIRPETVDPEEDGATWWLLLYASAAFVYRTVFLCTILLLVRDWMNPRSLEDVGNFIAFVVVATAVWSVGSTLRKKWKERGAKPMRAKHLIATGGLAAALIAGGLFVPVPWLTTSDVVVEPFDPVAVFTTVPGRLEEITRRPGDRVLAGDVVAKLANDELQEQRLDLTLRRSAAAVQRRVAVANADSTSVKLADEQITGLDAALAEVDRRIARLTVVAPSDGLLVAASERPDTSDGDRRETWSGRPTDPQNAGAFFEPGTLLGTIATGDDYQVRLYVPQHVRDDLEVGQPVSIRIESVPDRLFEGTIEEFAPEGQEFAEEAVSVKYGGGFATETDRSGRERFLTPSYVARVRVGDPDGLIVPGTRGVARFSRKSRPALSWLWRSAQQLIALR